MKARRRFRLFILSAFAFLVIADFAFVLHFVNYQGEEYQASGERYQEHYALFGGPVFLFIWRWSARIWHFIESNQDGILAAFTIGILLSLRFLLSTPTVSGPKSIAGERFGEPTELRIQHVLASILARLKSGAWRLFSCIHTAQTGLGKCHGFATAHRACSTNAACGTRRRCWPFERIEDKVS